MMMSSQLQSGPRVTRREALQRERGESSGRKFRCLEDGLGTQPGEQENSTVKQNTEQRRVLRAKYRQLQQTITGDREELIRLDSNRFNEVVGKIEDLHRQVQKPREQIADAEAVLDIASTVFESVKGATRKSGVSPAGFVGAIIENFGIRMPDDDNDLTTINWGLLGLQACGIICEVPGLHTMLGPMDIEPKTRKVLAPRKARVKPSQCTRPEEVKDQNEMDAKAETDANMETMFGILRNVKCARLDALVLNRRSFSQTVENIFSLSFLVKDGRIAITYDEDGTHLVVVLQLQRMLQQQQTDLLEKLPMHSSYFALIGLVGSQCKRD
ncbi:hypothetical protein CY35_07G111600 [Sphagnum magellanicum]|uniref:Uncharacterized protein n=1 Tax=Sphagnum magellanicum TaxID=128215 RepID=A0ACB8HNW4_9BRYO|nr:hypothetical protein CY35_07G111600 [Sphagnum magellanicum]